MKEEEKTARMDYIDDRGVQWVMAACGHYVGGSPKPGDKIAVCPNCSFLMKFKPINVVYPDLLPDDILVKGSAG